MSCSTSSKKTRQALSCYSNIVTLLNRCREARPAGAVEIEKGLVLKEDVRLVLLLRFQQSVCSLEE